MANKVIYTSVTGNYDELPEPGHIFQGWDYICFTDSPVSVPGSVWIYKPIPLKIRDKLRLSRYVKLNPHKVIPEYDYSLWIDANIRVTSPDLENLINTKMKNLVELSIPLHPLRNCIYEEATSCITDGKDSRKRIERLLEFLESEGFPKQFGLFENNIILRRHMTDKIADLNELWWDIYMKYSRRDQLSFTYALWKKNLSCEPLFAKGVSARNFPGLEYPKHKSSIKNKILNRLQKKINRL